MGFGHFCILTYRRKRRTLHAYYNELGEITMKFIAYPLLLAISVLIPVSAGAETIYLKDGSTITGKIKNVRPDEVVITTVIGEITIDSAKILSVDGITSTPEKAPIKSNAELRMQQKNGLGFGPSISSMLGIILFYDHNLSNNSQLHIQLNGNASSRYNYFYEPIIKTSRNMILTTYRYFPAENKGFYLGAGGGFVNSKLTYDNYSTSAPYKYTSESNGVFVLGEVGWQGNDGYYFHVGLQPAAYLSSNDNYDVNNIPNISNHRVAANEEQANLKILSQLSIGFGWFF